MNEIDKQKLIMDMCFTYRHDFGLNKSPDDPSWVAGMTDVERQMLVKTMTQIFNNNIEPYIQKITEGKIEWTDC